MTARLFSPNGRPTVTARERAFLRDVQRMHEAAETAMAELDAALDTDDVARAIEGSRRLLAIGLWLGDAAREVEAC